MNVTTPRYLLYAQADRHESGSWQFALRSPDGSEQFEAADVEPQIRGDRLDLLTVVRALESLDQPSQVTLVGCSRYIRQGLEYGLAEWRENGWRWEFFGEMVPVKNGDLWQRLDRVLRFHEVGCSRHRFDPSHAKPCEPAARRRPEAVESLPTVVTGGRASENGGRKVESGIRVADHHWVKYQESSVSGGSPRSASLLGGPGRRVVRWWNALVSRGWTTRNRGPSFQGKTA